MEKKEEYVWDPPNDGGAEKAQEVAAARELEARDDFLCHGCSANDVASLEHGHGETAACEVSGGYQAVVAGTDDQRVPFLLLKNARCTCTAAEASQPHLAKLAGFHGSLLGESSRWSR